ncbi:hypothetical protein HNP87_001818 [Methanococcus maripaludis]|uniref:Uncharacterized protein n=1 Tax=Methanococcus maripaludis TaxID=39152 RepID=A0A7J9NLX9_METMI|nr:hypothetical protein [Methanococcus maripaludis]MBA2841269.1 hypothetical protein [Methanococcus maripaludis]MBB6402695.1 hypothetical protein [Methanococcus maripaludis]
MEMDLIETITNWVKWEGRLDLKDPPRFVLETLERHGHTLENLEMALDLLTALGKFEKYKDSRVYIPLHPAKNQIGFFGLLK